MTKTISAALRLQSFLLHCLLWRTVCATPEHFCYTRRCTAMLLHTTPDKSTSHVATPDRFCYTRPFLRHFNRFCDTLATLCPVFVDPFRYTRPFLLHYPILECITVCLRQQSLPRFCFKPSLVNHFRNTSTMFATLLHPPHVLLAWPTISTTHGCFRYYTSRCLPALAAISTALAQLLLQPVLLGSNCCCCYLPLPTA